MFEKLTARLKRRKQYGGSQEVGDSKLARCLNTIDLTLLGVGSTLGVGVYVLAGAVARDTAGPSVVVSFLIAGVASALSGLCYAEFGARVPKAGSAYVYSYVTVGELAAFVIGWNLVLEYVIGTASVARGYSGYLDSLLNNTMKNTFREHMPMHASFLAEYPDWTAFSITLVLACVLSVGVQESSRFNNIFTLLNLSVVVFVVAAGASKANIENWFITDESAALQGTVGEEVVKEDNEVDLGAGGFFPFGVSGMLSGAATCFYGFVGFDAIATTGEETRNPQRSIPIAIIVSLIIVCIGYMGISGVLTLMVPYYLQDPDAPLPHAFRIVGLPEAAWVVALGALFGLSTSLLGAMFPLPRVIYAMANDGLLPRFLGSVHSTFQTPFIATILSGILSAVMALLFDLSQLVDMMSIGTLMAYTMVSLSVLLLRYKCSGGQPSDYTPLCTQDPFETEDVEELFPKNGDKIVYTRKEYTRQLFNMDGDKTPNPLSAHVAMHTTIIFTLLSVPFSLMVQAESTWYNKIGLAFIIIKLLFCVIVLSRQPSDVTDLYFKVPLVPLVPASSILINVFLTTKLSGQTWVRFSVWMLVGFIIYVAYGIKNSSEEYRMRGEVPPEQLSQGSNKSSSSR